MPSFGPYIFEDDSATDVKKQQQKSLGLEYRGWGNYLDNDGNHYRWHEDTHKFVKSGEKTPTTFKERDDLNTIWANKYRKWMYSLPKSTRSKLLKYKTDFYGFVNDYLREPDRMEFSSRPELTDKIDDYISVIDKAFEKVQPLESDITVYRGIHSYGAKLLKNSEEGDVFEDNAYVSTTLNKNKANSFGYTRFRIKVPKGTKAIYLDAFDVNKDEDYRNADELEMLLPRGSKFKITGEEQDGKVTYIDMVLV